MYLSTAIGLRQPANNQVSEQGVLRQLLENGLRVQSVINERMVDIYLSPDMAKLPYIPKSSSESREYWKLPEQARKQVNAIVDRIFREATGIVRKLDPKNPKDKPWIRTWLRLRDRIMGVRAQNSQSTTPVQIPDGITRVTTGHASSNLNITSTKQTTPVLHLERVSISHLPKIALKRIGWQYHGVFEQPIPRGGSFKVEITGRIRVDDAGIRRDYDRNKDTTNWPLAGMKGHASINITNTPGLSSDSAENVKIQSDGTLKFSNRIVVRGFISSLTIHAHVKFKNGEHLAAVVVLMLINLDTFLALLEAQEKPRLSTHTRIQFLGSVRKMFQPAQGSPLASIFNLFLRRNRQVDPLAPVHSDLALYFRYFENLTIGNEKVDFGHVLVGIEASRRQKPDSILPVATSDATTEAFMTWAGDLGSALEPYAEAIVSGRQVDIRSYLKEKASSADLLGDIDGINIGSVYDETKSLAENLRRYYSTKPLRRFHDYMVRLREDDGKPILTLAQKNPPRIDQASRTRVSWFISLFARGIIHKRQLSARLSASQYSQLMSMVQENSNEMNIVVDYFFAFIERGLANES